MKQVKWWLIVGLVLATAGPARTQQVPDPGFTPAIGKPEYQPGRGPRVLIDAAHLNIPDSDVVRYRSRQLDSHFPLRRHTWRHGCRLQRKDNSP